MFHATFAALTTSAWRSSVSVSNLIVRCGGVADGLGVTWHTANSAVIAEGRQGLIDEPARFEGVRVIGVDEHVWRHTHRGD